LRWLRCGWRREHGGPRAVTTSCAFADGHNRAGENCGEQNYLDVRGAIKEMK
jgi:hypothetical protein